MRENTKPCLAQNWDGEAAVPLPTLASTEGAVTREMEHKHIFLV